MAFKKVGLKEGDVPSGNPDSETWNIAQYFTAFSFAFPLKELDDLEKVARTGAVELGEDVILDNDSYAKRRVDAVKRYWIVLRQVVGNALFNFKGDDLEALNYVLLQLKLIKKNIWGDLIRTSSKEIDNMQMEIIEEELETYINHLTEYKYQILPLLNKAGLIFRQSENLDLDKIQRSIYDSG